MKITYTLTPNMPGAKMPENGRRYLIKYQDYQNNTIGVASARWHKIPKEFIYDALLFVGEQTPQMAESARYRILGWALIIKDWQVTTEEK